MPLHRYRTYRKPPLRLNKFFMVPPHKRKELWHFENVHVRRGNIWPIMFFVYVHIFVYV